MPVPAVTNNTVPQVAGLLEIVDHYAALSAVPARDGNEAVEIFSRDPARFCSGRGVLANDPLREGGTLAGSICGYVFGSSMTKAPAQSLAR